MDPVKICIDQVPEQIANTYDRIAGIMRPANAVNNVVCFRLSLPEWLRIDADKIAWLL